MRRATLGGNHPEVAETLRNLGQLAEQAQPERATGFYREALAIDRAMPGAPERIAESLAGLGRIATCRGELEPGRRASCARRSPCAAPAAPPIGGCRPPRSGWAGAWPAAAAAPRPSTLMEKARRDLEKTVGGQDPPGGGGRRLPRPGARQASAAPAGLRARRDRCSCSR